MCNVLLNLTLTCTYRSVNKLDHDEDNIARLDHSLSMTGTRSVTLSMCRWHTSCGQENVLSNVPMCTSLLTLDHPFMRSVRWRGTYSLRDGEVMYVLARDMLRFFKSM
jgi:hypothetical protein